LLSKLDFFAAEDARAINVHGRIVAEAVLCRTGQVTDVRIIEGLGHGMDETFISGLRRLRFTPAEKDWHTVSQLLRFEWHFNDEGPGITATQADGREVEALTVMGNRRIKDEEMLGWITTRPGEVFNVKQAQHDLQTICETGYFDTTSARLSLEEGLRGGVRVYFEVTELPLISEVKFGGLGDIPEAYLTDALAREKLVLTKGAVFDVLKVRQAIQVIRQVLSLYGFPNSEVEVHSEQPDFSSVRLTFAIKAKR
jgi:outer membrane protein assembly factor BamA